MAISNTFPRALQMASTALILTTWPVALWAEGSPSQASSESNGSAAEVASLSMAEIEAAWAAGDFVSVRQGLQHHAETTGAPFAQYRYGRVLLEGRGGPQDLMAARDWLERAAAQNQAEAAVLLARLYLSAPAGGPPRDPARAAVLFRQAAVRGQAEAQYYLGLLYGQGTGVTADPVEALTWLQAAAERDYTEAQFELSRAYASGRGTAEDPAKALHWLQAAATAGHAQAQYFLAYALDSGQGAPRNRAEALNWLHRSAEGGFLRAQVALGKKYLRGDGVEPNPQEALRWLALGVQADNQEAVLTLGLALLGGEGIAANPAQAQILLTQAAAEGQPAASHALGRMLEQGLGQPANLPEAVKLYRQAVDQGSTKAALRLGELAVAGQLQGMMAPHRMVPWVETLSGAAARDWLQAQAQDGLRPAQRAFGEMLLAAGEAETAAQWLTLAARAYDMQAQHQLGRLYIQGEGVEQDYVLAHKWLNLAAGAGDAKALEMRAVVADLMTPEQVAQAQALAREHLETARSGPDAQTLRQSVPQAASQ